LAYTLDTTYNEQNILRSIEEAVGEENIIPSSKVGDYAIDGKIPKIVVSPKDVESISKLLKYANEAGLSVIPRGGGTKMDLGGIPKTVDVILSLLNLNRIIEYAPEDLVVTAQAGIKLADLQRTLAKNGQRLPLDPPYTDVTTLGGIVSSNASGPMRYRYGSCRDLLLGVRVATPSGAVIKLGGKVVKNVAGYDLRRLYIGSLGTLGVITELTFRLYPIPESEKTFIACFQDVKKAADLASRILNSELLPYAIEALNHEAARIVADEAGVQLAEDKYALVLGFGDVDESVRKQLATLEELARSSGASKSIAIDEGCHESTWTTIRNLPRYIAARLPKLIAFKVSVPISKALEACEALEHLATEEGHANITSSHVGNGIIHFYLSAETGDAGVLSTFISKARQLTSQMDGTLIVEKCPPSVKPSVDVWGPSQNGAKLMQAIKSQFDPRGILSPGRFIGAI
jgi:glycolate oxidase FAD binding subunit